MPTLTRAEDVRAGDLSRDDSARKAAEQRLVSAVEAYRRASALEVMTHLRHRAMADAGAELFLAQRDYGRSKK